MLRMIFPGQQPVGVRHRTREGELNSKEPVGNGMIEEQDIMVPMRDGIALAVDVYRPDAPGIYPTLYTCALHNKDLQRPELADVIPPQPAYSSHWYGVIEGGDTRRFVANGYAHVHCQIRGAGKSEGVYGDDATDHYDIIEWITQQPWSNGKVGMVGISAFGGEQFRAAAQGHPALKAIFPYDPMGVYGGMWGFRDFHPGGVIHTMLYYLFPLGVVHEPCSFRRRRFRRMSKSVGNGRLTIPTIRCTCICGASSPRRASVTMACTGT
jgi:predicted acyl esterase